VRRRGGARSAVERPDLGAVLRCARDAALAAGRLLAARLGHPGRVTIKPAGPVTESDTRAERIILSVIRRTFPDHAVLAEEAGPVGAGQCRWIIDPLDGTTNFMRGIPWYDVSIAFEYQGRVEVGVVYAPSLDLLFAGARGQGARLNGRRIRPSARRRLAGSLMDAGLSRGDWADDHLLTRLARVAEGGAQLRSLNACGLDLAYVAVGWLDAYWDAHASPWDIAAGALLVREAGGRVTTWSHSENPDGPATVLASVAGLHTRLVRVLRRRGHAARHG
jgi:myo-inositol-1(or 4)-monophosphatase